MIFPFTIWKGMLLILQYPSASSRGENVKLKNWSHESEFELNWQTSKLLTPPPPPPVTLNTTLESLKYELHFSIMYVKSMQNNFCWVSCLFCFLCLVSSLISRPDFLFQYEICKQKTVLVCNYVQQCHMQLVNFQNVFLTLKYHTNVCLCRIWRLMINHYDLGFPSLHIPRQAQKVI